MESGLLLVELQLAEKFVPLFRVHGKND